MLARGPGDGARKKHGRPLLLGARAALGRVAVGVDRERGHARLDGLAEACRRGHERVPRRGHVRAPEQLAVVRVRPRDVEPLVLARGGVDLCTGVFLVLLFFLFFCVVVFFVFFVFDFDFGVV